MRWSIIRLIWARELRDQLRDRRTLFMVAILPLLLYPVLGYLLIHFALGFTDRPSVIGVVRSGKDQRDFPPRLSDHSGVSALPHLAWLSATPAGPGSGAAAFARAGHYFLDYPPLIRSGNFTSLDTQLPLDQAHLLMTQAKLRIEWLDADAFQALDDKTVDLLLETSTQFYWRLEIGEDERAFQRPAIALHLRPDDDHSQQAKNRLLPLLETWKKELKKVRLARKNLPSDYDEPFQITETPQVLESATQTAGIFHLVVRIFPFMLVMWSLAGALYPAVDLCAGEKERGTMETLLITPAGREEIVLGKFLTIWVFSAASAFLNLLSMGLTTWQFGAQLPQGSIPVAALLWCVVLSLPLSALFSAVCLAIGAYARSSKEGQYYLMPLFLITMPLIFLSMAPGVELNPFYSLVPVTGVALLMQKLMTATSLAQVPWLYFIPVLAPVVLYSWLALKWAIIQFHREEVLFREAERLELKLWFRSLFREKEAVPTTSQALFLFGLLLALQWLALGLGGQVPSTVKNGIRLLAFVAAPTLFMTVMLNTQPRQALFLRLPTAREVGLAAVLAVLLLPPMAALSVAVFSQYPRLVQLLEVLQPLVQELRAVHQGFKSTRELLPHLLVYALLPALCEEIAFRGYMLTGLMRRFRPRTAIILCGFLFALFHLNVFQFLPAFFLGVVLGLMTVRSKSLVPAILFHFLHNSVLLLSIYFAPDIRKYIPETVLALTPWLTGACLAVALSLLWWLYRKPYVELERQLALEEERSRV